MCPFYLSTLKQYRILFLKIEIVTSHPGPAAPIIIPQKGVKMFWVVATLSVKVSTGN